MDSRQVHLKLPEFWFLRVQRKLIKLWYYRQEAVLGALYKELHECEWVTMGGSAAKRVSKYLGHFGALHWVRDGKGTEEEWRRYRHALRQYAIQRAAMLQARVDKVEKLVPPEPIEPPKRAS